MSVRFASLPAFEVKVCSGRSGIFGVVATRPARRPQSARAAFRPDLRPGHDSYRSPPHSNCKDNPNGPITKPMNRFYIGLAVKLAILRRTWSAARAQVERGTPLAEPSARREATNPEQVCSVLYHRQGSRRFPILHDRAQVAYSNGGRAKIRRTIGSNASIGRVSYAGSNEVWSHFSQNAAVRSNIGWPRNCSRALRSAPR